MSARYEERVSAFCKEVVDQFLADENHDTDVLNIVDFLRSVGALFVPHPSEWETLSQRIIVVTPRYVTLLIHRGGTYYSVPFYHFHDSLNERQLRLLESVYQTKWWSLSSSVSPVHEQFSFVLRTYIPGDAYVGDGIYHRYVPTSAMSVFTWDAIDEQELQVVQVLSDGILDQVGVPLVRW